MALDFPASPSVNQIFTAGSISYKWDGAKWIGLGLTPADRLVEGSNKLEIDGSNNLVWTGGNLGVGVVNPTQKLMVKGIVASEASNSTNNWMAYTFTDNTFRINYNGVQYDIVKSPITLGNEQPVPSKALPFSILVFVSNNRPLSVF